jgi:hypothetical protein
VAATTINPPYVIAGKKTPIKWRMQTYAGPALAAHVIKPQIDAFNKAANGEMIIELFNADQLVPHAELFRAMTKGGKLELTSIPKEEWKKVEDAAYKYWDEIAAKSETDAKVVKILKDYVKTMEAAGPPYRY